jgi:2',3'-cyclic-nucleotide 2'-phosphodiesterase (5'-nucleotidase family)
MVKEQWFIDAVNFKQPVDLFVVIGHNPIRTTNSASTFGLLHNTIRSMQPNIPIQAFGGHTHIRDFQVYDDMSTGFEAGKSRPSFSNL